MMLSIKALLPLVILPFSALAQTVLSPPECTLQCVKLSVSSSSCADARGGLNDPSVVPCLCEDTPFMRDTVDCILNSGECRSVEEQKNSFKYAVGLCGSVGITYKPDLAGEFGVSITATASATTPLRSTSTLLKLTTPTVSITTIEETLTSTLAVVRSSACPTLPPVNVTYMVVVSNNVTQTLFPQPTEGHCGNYTSATKVVTTRRSTRTETLRSTETESTSTEEPVSTSTEDSGAGSQNVQAGFMLAFVGALMCLV